MAKTPGQLVLSADITTSFRGPLDNKTQARTLADMLNPASWKVMNPMTGAQVSVAYVGMLVSVVEDSNVNNGLYRFTGTNAANDSQLSNISNWVKYPTSLDVATPIKGTWTPSVTGGTVSNLPEGGYGYVVIGNSAVSLGLADGDIAFINPGGTKVQRVITKPVDVPSSSDELNEGSTNLFLTAAERLKLANLAQDADSTYNKVEWNNVTGRPTDLSQFTDNEDLLEAYSSTGSITNTSEVPGATLDDVLDTLTQAVETSTSVTILTSAATIVRSGTYIINTLNGMFDVTINSYDAVDLTIVTDDVSDSNNPPKVRFTGPALFEGEADKELILDASFTRFTLTYTGRSNYGYSLGL